MPGRGSRKVQRSTWTNSLRFSAGDGAHRFRPPEAVHDKLSGAIEAARRSASGQAADNTARLVA
jgi:hypothetical protein